MTDHLAVANEILRQLGGGMFKTMTGAKALIACPGYGHGALSFKPPSRFAKDGINYVKVSLTAGDDYTVNFGKVWGSTYKEISRSEGVYCDDLRAVFTEFTGLDTSLGRPPCSAR